MPLPKITLRFRSCCGAPNHKKKIGSSWDLYQTRTNFLFQKPTNLTLFRCASKKRHICRVFIEKYISYRVQRTTIGSIIDCTSTGEGYTNSSAVLFVRFFHRQRLEIPGDSNFCGRVHDGISYFLPLRYQ